MRSKSKGKTGNFERYIAAQCLKPGMQMVLALLHMPALEDTACARVHVVPNYIHLQVNFSQTIDPSMMRFKIPYE